jgi:hypothetical protein
MVPDMATEPLKHADEIAFSHRHVRLKVTASDSADVGIRAHVLFYLLKPISARRGVIIGYRDDVPVDAIETGI